VSVWVELTERLFGVCGRDAELRHGERKLTGQGAPVGQVVARGQRLMMQAAATASRSATASTCTRTANSGLPASPIHRPKSTVAARVSGCRAPSCSVSSATRTALVPGLSGVPAEACAQYDAGGGRTRHRVHAPERGGGDRDQRQQILASGACGAASNRARFCRSRASRCRGPAAEQPFGAETQPGQIGVCCGPIAEFTIGTGHLAAQEQHVAVPVASRTRACRRRFPPALRAASTRPRSTRVFPDAA